MTTANIAALLRQHGYRHLGTGTNPAHYYGPRARVALYADGIAVGEQRQARGERRKVATRRAK